MPFLASRHFSGTKKAPSVQTPFLADVPCLPSLWCRTSLLPTIALLITMTDKTSTTTITAAKSHLMSSGHPRYSGFISLLLQIKNIFMQIEASLLLPFYIISFFYSTLSTCLWTSGTGTNAGISTRPRSSFLARPDLLMYPRISDSIFNMMFSPDSVETPAMRG
jgi:hypothetical protein